MWSLDNDGGPFRIGIYIIGTGHTMPVELAVAFPAPRFIGTVVTPSELVWHVFQGPVIA